MDSSNHDSPGPSNSNASDASRPALGPGIPSTSGQTTRKRRNSSLDVDVFMQDQKKIKEETPEDEYDVAGKKYAITMRALSPPVQTFVGNLIKDVLFKAESGFVDINTQIKVTYTKIPMQEEEFYEF